jgi:hypothetical protein
MDRLLRQIRDRVQDFLGVQGATVFRAKDEGPEVHLDFRVESSTGVRVYRMTLKRTS